MRTAGLVVLLTVILSLGCARVRVEGSKEPIKLDITMRLDVYQHVAKDIDDIENMVSGTSAKASGGNSSLLNLMLKNAYAEDGLSPEVEKAALSRKDRRLELVSLEQKGLLGENKVGLVEIRPAGKSDDSVGSLVKAENEDRMVIYNAIAKKNGANIADVQKLYAKRLQEDAVPGTPIEELNESTGTYEWKIK
jgi:uncharacterized protein YdbL (DUF1318 family)